MSQDNQKYNTSEQGKTNTRKRTQEKVQDIDIQICRVRNSIVHTLRNHNKYYEVRVYTQRICKVKEEKKKTIWINYNSSQDKNQDKT